MGAPVDAPTMCNFTMAPEILERFAEGKAELEIKIFCAFCLSEDFAMGPGATEC